jgi:hypothetical protein
MFTIRIITMCCIALTTMASDYVVEGRNITVSNLEFMVVGGNEENETVADENVVFTIDERYLLRNSFSKESFSPISDLRKNSNLLQAVGFDIPQYLDSSATLHLIFSSDQEKNKDICEIILLDSKLDSLGKKKLMKFVDINNIESHEYDNYMTLTCKENTK